MPFPIEASVREWWATCSAKRFIVGLCRGVSERFDPVFFITIIDFLLPLKVCFQFRFLQFRGFLFSESSGLVSLRFQREKAQALLFAPEGQ